MSRSVDELATAFLDLTLPKGEFTHEAHLRVGLWHVLRHSPDDALNLLRERIRRFNESVGGANTDSAGYHESITRFYVVMIGHFLATTDRTRPTDTLADALIRDFGDRTLPYQFWSKDVLMSSAARLGWIDPDVKSLPRSRQGPPQGAFHQAEQGE